jgi:ubiquinone/menaquinone biosynthesis C-methylase UbiE
MLTRSPLPVAIGSLLLVAAAVCLWLSSSGPAPGVDVDDLVTKKHKKAGSFFDDLYTEQMRDNGMRNLGFRWHWDDFTSNLTDVEVYMYFQKSGAEMARQLGEFIDLNVRDRLVDVGCGLGWQDNLWADEFNVREIRAYNIGAEQIRRAKENREYMFTQAGYDAVSFGVADAVALPEPDCSANKMTSLESAFHYKTREDFFREAFRILCPGGVLGLADILPTIGNGAGGYSEAAGRRRLPPPSTDKPDVVCKDILSCRANTYDILTYRQKLLDIGFVDFRAWDITAYIFAWRKRDNDQLRYFLISARKP